jgi:hypothetical protein
MVAATRQPSLAKRSAVARPIPVEAPVMMTIFDCSLILSATCVMTRRLETGWEGNAATLSSAWEGGG